MSSRLPALALMLVRRPAGRGLLLALLLLLLAVLASLLVGSQHVAPAVVLDALLHPDPHNDAHLIVRELRVPRTVVALLAGLALGAAGTLMQALTRNPLAEPGLLGVNGGAALAVILGVAVLGASQPGQLMLLAFMGAGGAGGLVMLLGQAGAGDSHPVRLVLAGAGLSMLLAALTGMLVLNTPPQVYDHFRHWAAGSLAGSSLAALPLPALAIAVGLGLAAGLMPRLNALALGHDLGRALGVNLRLTWALACVALMLLAGSATAIAGPIGFIGLVAPHLARLLVGPDYRRMLPYAALFAALLLLGADLLGRVLAQPAELAAGTLALLLGGPAFILLIRRYRLCHL
ncbi:iron ABC transporter permease [Pantoea sp. Ap-967]|uniref:FecCD family ABC transporter permease n=1 Tax=Pantoea sp. Ap-967 TaxID=2608362 RepID=UPI001420D112|nr:iron ABC transporter permease [Pantoea sp. Ap-967]NIE77656.1 iron ABC transporter permease [Pantoea sp. Ap-967]